MNKQQIANFIFAVAVIFSATVIGNAQCVQAGCLDVNFGLGGTVFTSIPATSVSSGKAVMQNDGKILALVSLNGSISTDAIIRYNPNGTLDSSFNPQPNGSGGIVYLNWSGANNTRGYTFAIAVQTVAMEQRIIVAGSGAGGSTNLRVDRFHSDGSPDTSFGLGGTANLNVPYALAIAVQPDGKILTMGDVGGLVRLNFNGSLDTTFGSGGVIQNRVWQVRSLALQSNGRIIAAGYWWNQKGIPVMSVWRFNTNGSLDGGPNDSTKSDSFGKSGQTTIDSMGGGSAFDVKIDGSGKIVVAGAGSNDFAVVRLTSGGQLDSTFGLGGIRMVDFNGLDDIAKSVGITANGQIVLVGFTMTTSTNRNTALARFNSNGSLDNTFGQGGRVVSDFSSEEEFPSNGMLQFDPGCNCEKIIGVGTVKIGGIYNAFVARYLP